MVDSVSLYLLCIGLLGLERLVELVVSRRNARRAAALGGVEVGRRDFPLMALVHTLFLVSCVAEVLWFQRPFPGALGYVALGLAVMSQGLRYWAIAALGPRWNVRIILVPGQPPITTGPYRYIRHPNYLAVIIELFFVPLIHGAWLTALFFSVMNAFVLRTRIRAEETALGEPWLAAFANKPRFFPDRGQR